jgi:glycosyltransferase involved in cell wall biosynthesis
MTRILGRRSSETVAAPRSWVVGASATYVVTLVLAYLVFISPQFSDGGLVNKLAGVDSLIVAVILAVVPALWLPATARRPSDAGLWLVYTVGYVPSIVVPPFILGSGWGLLPLWVALASSFVVVVIVADRVQLHLPRVNLSPTAFGLLLVLLAVGGLVVMLILFGLPDGLPTLDRVYETRSEFRDALERTGAIGGYAVWWSGQVVAPLLVTYGLWSRRPAMVIAGAALFAYVYALAGFRSMLFAGFLLIALIALVVRLWRWFGVAIPALASALIIACAAVAAAGWMLPLSLLVRRLLVVPGEVIAYYYDFFATRPGYGLSHSILSGIVPRPYPESPPVLIGKHYFLAPGINANGNLWADGMANFGLVGVVGASLLLGLLLLVMDAVARGKSPAMTTAVGGVGVWSLTNSGLLTSIMTHGIGPLIALLWLMPPPRRAVPNVPLRVVHLTSVHRSDDPRIYLKECRTLAAAGFDVTLIARGPAPPPGAVQFVAIPDVRGRLARMVIQPFRVFRAARRIRADVYHIHDPELIPVAIALKLVGARALYDAHEDLPRQIAYKAYIPSRLRRPIALVAAGVEQVTVRLIDGVVAATPRIAARFPTRKVAIVQNFPIVAEFGEPSGEPYDRRPALVAYVGRLTEVVGGLVMADAARIVGQSRPIQFVFAGPVGDPLAAQIRERAAPVEVELPGWQDRDEVVALLQSARVGLVLFQPVENYVEAYPTKLFEYMASAIPVVASDFPVWREIVGSDDCGLLVDPTDADAVARAIVELLDDPERAAAMGVRGRKAVLERYRWDIQGARLVDWYAEILGRGAPMPSARPAGGTTPPGG